MKNTPILQAGTVAGAALAILGILLVYFVIRFGLADGNKKNTEYVAYAHARNHDRDRDSLFLNAHRHPSKCYDCECPTSSSMYYLQKSHGTPKCSLGME
jgi:hypothetical protein